MGLKLVEPSLQGDHRLWAEMEKTNPGVFPGPLIGDDPGAEKDAQVPAHGRSRRGDRRRQLASSPGAGTQQLHDLTPRRVRQRLEKWGHVRVELCQHYDNS
jgi:hypothetical protein